MFRLRFLVRTKRFTLERATFGKVVSDERKKETLWYVETSD